METVARNCLMATIVFAGASAAWSQDAKPGGDQGPPRTPEKAEKAELGKDAPEFELKNDEGKTVRLADYADKTVVLEWINRGCPASVGALPTMRKTAVEYAKKGVVWLAIDSTYNRKPEDNVEHRKANKLPYMILMDGDGQVGRTYGATRTPHMFVIQKSKLVYMGAIDDGSMGRPGKRNYVAEALDAVLDGKDVEVSKTTAYGCTVKYAPASGKPKRERDPD